MDELAAVEMLVSAGYRGLPLETIEQELPGAGEIVQQMSEDLLWRDHVSVFDGQARVRYTPMTFVDTLFESQSGFSTTGATVISELEDPEVVPHCILFWRSTTHFLGGLGIIVLFVVILGQGSAGKALMRAELPGPTQESAQAQNPTRSLVFRGDLLWVESVVDVDPLEL